MRIARASAGVLLAMVLLLGDEDVVWAHANFLRSDPAPNSVLQTAPERLQLWFTEPLEPGFSEVQVIDESRQRLDRGDSQVLREDTTSLTVSLQALDRGTYTVTWKALSAVDGHVTRGFFTLSIGVAAPAVQPPLSQEIPPQLPFEAAVRWLGYLSVAAVIGGLLFRLLVMEPVAERQRLSQITLPVSMHFFRLTIWTGWGLLLVATLASLALQITAVSGDSSATVVGTLRQLLLDTRYGLVFLTRLVLIVVLGLTLLWLAKRHWAWWLAISLGGAVLFTTSLNSHSAAVSGLAPLAIAADWLHLFGVSIWVGGLLSLVVVLPSALSSLAPGDRWRFLAQLVPRFSVMASASLMIIIGSSLFLVWLHVGSFGALLETLYGGSLLIKAAVIAPLLLLGATNLLFVRPYLAKATAGAGSLINAARLGKRFSRIVLAEAALAALALLATSILTSMPPARQVYEQLVATRPLEMTANAQDLRLTLTIAPGRPGINTFTLRIIGRGGMPVENAEGVFLTLSYLSEALGTNIAVAQHQGDGRYLVEGQSLGVEGRWQAEVLVRRQGLEDARTAFRFSVAPSSAEQEQATGLGSGLRLPAIDVMTVVGIAIMLFGIGLVAYVVRSVGLRSFEGSALILASLVVMGLGVYLAIQAQSSIGAAASTTQLTNPFPPTQESLTNGQRLYTDAGCQLCHGINGRGDGPAGLALQPPPADFRIHMAAGHTDAQLFNWLSEGVQGTAMPAFKDRLSTEERWHVLNFLRTFAQN